MRMRRIKNMEVSILMGVHPNGGFKRETHEDPIKMDDLGVPPFVETPISGLIASHRVLSVASFSKTAFLLS